MEDSRSLPSLVTIRLLLTCFLLVCFLLAASPTAANSPSSCAGLSTEREAATVKTVVDGDTVRLTDGRRIRIIGLNAPELQPEPQPYARQARQRIRELLNASDRRVQLITDNEPQDRHGRHLFHILMPDGRSLAGTLIEEGLAVQTSVAPNTTCAHHYSALEQNARDAEVGLWNNTDFWRASYRKLSARTQGFHFIQDRVVDVKNSTSRVQLFLKHGVIVNIALPQTLLNQHGEIIPPEQLINQSIEVRGWLYRYRKQHHLKLHHHTNLRVLEP